MKTVTILLTVTVLATGCSSIQPLNTFVPTEQDLQARAQYYEDLNHEQHLANIDTVAEIESKLERAPAEAEPLLEARGWTKADYDIMVRQIRAEAELNDAFEAALMEAEAVQANAAAVR